MKKLQKTLAASLAFLLLVSVTACGAAPSAPGAAPADTAAPAGEAIDWDTYEASGKVIEWNWNQQMLDNMVEVYAERFPNVEYAPLVVNDADMMTKIQTALASGGETPDIMLGNQDWRGSLYDLGIYEDLEAAPYNFDTTKIMDTVLPQLRDKNGKFSGFDQQFAPAAFAYRRDLAEQYFGVSEPDDVAELISTWDKFAEAGAKLAEQTEDVYMMAGMMDLAETHMMQNSFIGWTDPAANTVDVTGRYQKGLEDAYAIAARVPLGQMATGSTEWHSSYNEGTVIFYNMTTWTSRSYVAGNFPESEGQGLWGVCKAPGETTGFKGGTCIGVNSQGKNKEAAYAMIYYLYSTVEGANTMFERLGYVPAIKEFYEGENAAILAGGFYDGYYKDQNIALYLFEKVVPLASADQYDGLFVSAKSSYNAVAAQIAADPDIDAAGALQLIIDGVKTSLPEATVK